MPLSLTSRDIVIAKIMGCMLVKKYGTKNILNFLFNPNENLNPLTPIATIGSESSGNSLINDNNEV